MIFPTIKHWLGVFVAAIFRDQPVQAVGAAQWSEGQFGRLAVAARRLARAVELFSRRLARFARGHPVKISRSFGDRLMTGV